MSGNHTTPASVLACGDTIVDVQAGVNSGASITVGVLTGKLTRSDFETAGELNSRGVALLGGVADVPALLDR